MYSNSTFVIRLRDDCQAVLPDDKSFTTAAAGGNRTLLVAGHFRSLRVCNQGVAALTHRPTF